MKTLSKWHGRHVASEEKYNASWRETCHQGTFTPANSRSGFRASWPKGVLKKTFWKVFLNSRKNICRFVLISKDLVVRPEVPSVHWQGHLWPHVPRAETWWCRAKAPKAGGGTGLLFSGEWCVLVLGDFVAVKRFFPFQTLKNFVRGCLPWKCWRRAASEIPVPTWKIFCCGFLAFNKKAGIERSVSPSSKNYGAVKHVMSPRLVASFLCQKVSFFTCSDISIERADSAKKCMFREWNSQASCRIHYYRAQSVEECIAGLLTAFRVRIVVMPSYDWYCCLFSLGSQKSKLRVCFSLVFSPQEYTFPSWIWKEYTFNIPQLLRVWTGWAWGLALVGSNVV